MRTWMVRGEQMEALKGVAIGFAIGWACITSMELRITRDRAERHVQKIAELEADVADLKAESPDEYLEAFKAVSLRLQSESEQGER